MGCTLFSDQGFGVCVVHELDRRFEFPEHVWLVDGGSIGVHLIGTVAQADRVIAIDILRNDGIPGTIYRLEGQQIIDRLNAAEHVLQEAFIEALIHCQMLERPPRATLLGIEPEDAEALTCSLTTVLAAKAEEMIVRVLKELDGLEVVYKKKQEI